MLIHFDFLFQMSRPGSSKAVFLITDGYSNGGDPRPAANVLKSKELGVTVFTFGIRNGNVKELRDMAEQLRIHLNSTTTNSPPPASLDKGAEENAAKVSVESRRRKKRQATNFKLQIILLEPF